MLFKEDDFTTTFKFEGKSASGSYDQIVWKIDGGSDLSAKSAEMATLHELFHWTLNNSTAYGMVLQVFAIIQDEYKGERTDYLDNLVELARRCKLAHEVYATWMSVTAVMEDEKMGLELELLADYPDYLYYFSRGEELVSQIGYRDFAVLMLGAVITFCFQSASISQAAVTDLDSFRAGDFRPIDFPETRLDLIAAHFGPALIAQILADYEAGEQGHDLAAYKAEREKNPDRRFADQDAPWITVFNDYVHAALTPFFEARNSFSMPPNGHLAMMKIFFEKIEEKFSGQNACPSIFSDVYDMNRNIIVNLETETIVVRDEILKASLKFPSRLTDDDREAIFKRLPEPLVLLANSAVTMYHQFAWPDETDSNWLSEREDAVTCLHFWLEDGVVFVPFEDPGELNELFAAPPDTFKVIAQISLTALRDNWEKKWWDVFYQGSDMLFYLNDVSMLIYVENLMEEKKEGSYMAFRSKVNGREFKAIVFQFMFEEKVIKSVICPCSASYSVFIKGYIEKHAPMLKYESVMSEVQDDYTFQLLGDLFSQLHFWRYKTHLVIDRLVDRNVK